jgi:hypothetical protein
MAAIERARKVLHAEAEAVIHGLRTIGHERDRLTDALRALDAESVSLVHRGRAAGVPVMRMAEALGTSRQHIHAVIRDERRPSRGRRRRGGGRRA